MQALMHCNPSHQEYATSHCKQGTDIKYQDRNSIAAMSLSQADPKEKEIKIQPHHPIVVVSLLLI